ncbi:hypothetical protein H4R99_008041 [Coemansia sp. RSA 1722]|nr:hypothetical protein LPJ57_003490 [Coemansia sp. RSA 486]KAJ2220066.1 hypothetical protein IWW45_009186 [Coemansia sp. RSA 485]KAJ2587743.1 hypothetical protein H4R99_008041 [Coemansia sp. RSA 1722]KAJ2695805.1 hypothetical protein FB645_006363 [Coemansia sp. IMI 203386]
MENETLKRKARLMAMRKAAAAKTEAEAGGDKGKDKDKSNRQDDRADVAEETDRTESALHDTIEAAVSGVVEEAVARRQQEVEAHELDIAAIAPKRANWDLKRSLQQRLDKLKAKNEAAVAELIGRRIKESAES